MGHEAHDQCPSTTYSQPSHVVTASLEILTYASRDHGMDYPECIPS
jgi:hypothetical protein